MTTYNTKNPVPSADARDRYDNSQVFDELMNGTAPSTPDRLGVLRQSWAGMEQAFAGSEADRAAAFQAFLDASGWSTMGDYAAGISIISHTQTFDYEGQPYQLKPSVPASIDAPYVTTGNWETEGINFKLVGDNSLRQDLAASDGLALIGTPDGTLGEYLENFSIKPLPVSDAAPYDRPLGLGEQFKFNVVTVPDVVRLISSQASVNWEVGSSFDIFNDSDGVVLLSPDVGVTVEMRNGVTNKVLQKGVTRVTKIAADKWVLSGDLVESVRPGIMRAFGDSITYGVGASSLDKNYVNTEGRLLARTIQNNAVSASMVWDQLAVLYVFTIENTDTTQLMIGTNDRHRGTTNHYQQECFKASHLAALVWMAVPDSSRTFPNNSNAVYDPPGNWGEAAYGKISTRYAAIVGSKVTVPFYGPTVYVHYLKTDGDISSAELRVDGVLVGSINCAGSGGGTILGATFGAAVFRIAGLSDAPHSLELKVVVGGTTGSVQFLGISVPELSKPLPRANILGVIRTSDDANTADIITYNNMIQDNVRLLVSDGLDVVYLDALSVINNTTDLEDALHPNDSGHAKLGRAAAIRF